MSSLQPKDFDKAFSIVESALEATRQQQTGSPSRVSYKSLIRSHGVGPSPHPAEYMQQIENVLVESGNGRYQANDANVKQLVFYYTCRDIIKVPLPPDVLLELLNPKVG